MLIAIDSDEIAAARQRVHDARIAFDGVRNARIRSEYDIKFKAVVSALNDYNALRDRLIKQLNLEIM